MVLAKNPQLRRWISAKARRWANPLLARPLANLSDREIDHALDHAGLGRCDLFSPDDAIAHHRIRMAHMLAALEIDVGEAVATHWAALKHADGVCSRCTQSGRCRRWLEWGQRNDAAHVFCPNATLLASVAADQANRRLRWYLG